MEKIYVADTYKHYEIIGEPVANQKGHLYVKVKGICPRCSGSGNYSFNLLDGSVCYGCFGRGYIVTNVRAYTEKEYNRMVANKERARKRKEEERAAREKDLIVNAQKYKHEVALKLGFNEDEKIFIVYGGDTYTVKDQLKELGARFNPTLKWYLPKKVELPEGLYLCEFSFDELYDYSIKTKSALFKNGAKDIISHKIAEVRNDVSSEFYPGEEKDRIYDLQVKVDNIRGFNGLYGYTYIYTFVLENYVFVWMTAKNDLKIAADDIVNLTGTIKKFEEYNGVKNTYITRCTVKKEEE